MMLIQDWRHVIKKAWSVKCSILSALFGGAEVAVQLWQPAWIPNGVFAGVAVLVTMLSIVFRVLAQQELSGGGK